MSKANTRKSIKKICTALLACILFLICTYSPAVFAEEGEAGSFYLMACTEYDILIEPVAIHYTAGQSIKDALLSSGYSFGELEERDWIDSVEGVPGNYSRFYDENGYDLSLPADSITALLVTEMGESYSDELFALLVRLGQFNEMTNHVQAYAATEYSAALKGVQRGVSGEQAQTLLDNLNAAITAYEEMLAGEKYNVDFNVSNQDGTLTEDFTLKLTDAYGNVTTSETAQIQVIAGSYNFVVTSGFNRTEGNFEVRGDTSVSVTLPSEEWYGNIRVLCDGDYVDSSQLETEHKITFYVDDSTNNVSTNGITLFPALGRGVPDRDNTVLYKIYTNTQGENVRAQVSWGNQKNSLAGLLDNSMKGNTALLEAEYVDEDGYKMIQSYDLEFIRIPTLSAIAFEDAQGVNYLAGFSPTTKSYSFSVPVGEYTVVGTPYSDQGYEVCVNENENASNVTIAEGSNTITIEVSHENEQSRTYTLTVTGSETSKTFFNVPEQTTLQVFTAAGSLLLPGADGGYNLVPGNEYSYTATKDIYYQSSAIFTAAEGTLTLDVAEPDTQDALDAFAFYDLSSIALREEYLPDKNFVSSDHEYLYVAEDASTSLYTQATVRENSGYQAYARFTVQHAYSTTARSTKISYPVAEDGAAVSLVSALMACGYSQTVTIALEKTEEGITYTQNYIMRIARKEQLKKLFPTINNTDLLLYDEQGTSVVSFDREITSYSVKVSKYSEEIKIAGAFTNENINQQFGGGYSVQIGEEIYTDLSEGVEILLDPAESEECITLIVSHEDEKAVPTTYTIIVKKFDPVSVVFDITPEDATVFVVDDVTSKPVYSVNNVYALEPGRSYTWTATKNGYVGKTGSYTASDAADTISVSLDEAPGNPKLNPNLSAEWPYFRADADNNGVVNYKTPTSAENTVLYWATKAGEGWGGQACGCPIIVDGYLYVYASSMIYKVDIISGQIVARGVMDRNSSFAINSPAYADGMIFVGLSNGGVQAFNAETLESLWIYNDPIAAQPNCPIVYHDGYIYTGFWKGEVNNASFVCLSVTDEDPNNTLEEKLATWRHVQKGGFYWAGAYACDDFVLVGTDDGATGYVTGHAEVLSIEPKTGEIIDHITLPFVGDLRSSIMHDTATGDYYFTTKGGYFYRLSMNEDGTITENSLRYVKLNNYTEDPRNPAMSTCTPVIYNGRAYIGVSGTGQFVQYSGHNITVIDLNSMRIAYKVRTQGYPQTSGLLSTANAEADDTVYVYFVDNMTPGKLRVISDRPGQSEPNETTLESFNDNGKVVMYDTAYVLFTPTGEQAQYAICSPIADETGTLYFKNDSGCLMAIGPTIDRLEITEPPAKTEYQEGESFNPEGMKVTAFYSNGTSRDVTEYVAYSEEPLGTDDTEFEIRFEYVMYQDKDGEAGVVYDAPTVFLNLTIGSSSPGTLGDINGDGTVNAADVSELIFLISKDNAPDVSLGDLNGDGTVNAADVSELIRTITGNVN